MAKLIIEIDIPEATAAIDDPEYYSGYLERTIEHFASWSGEVTHSEWSDDVEVKWPH